jgi:chromosome segregation ATPase
MRGYDREQVDREISRLDDDLRVTAAEREAAAARSADLAAQLASAQAQIELLHRQLRAASDTLTVDNAGEHVKQIIASAQADATQIRSAAHAEAEQARAAANAQLAEADETVRSRLAQVEAHRAEVEAALAQAEAGTRAQQERLSAEAAAERARLDAQADAERKRADEDFDITLRIKRSAAVKEHAEAHAGAEAEAAQLIAAAHSDVERLNQVRAELHGQLEALQDKLRAALEESRSTGSGRPA